MFLITIVLSAILLIFDLYLIYQIKKKYTLNGSLQETINYQRDSIRNLSDNHDKLLEETKNLLKEKTDLDKNIGFQQEKANLLQQSCNNADEEYKKKLELMANSLKAKEQETNQQYDVYCLEQEERLQEVSIDFLKEWRLTNENLQLEKNNLVKQVEEYRSILNAAIDAAKRAQLEKEQKDYYKIQLDAAAASDIAKLRAIEDTLTHPESLNKIIWKVYYEKPVSDMIGRVVGSTIKTGIYKITNCENQMSYVGQSLNIASRFKQHIRRGIGAESPTQNKLYPAMKEYGVENFSYEILEECDSNDLDAQEDYWQEFYRAKEFGYSIK